MLEIRTRESASLTSFQGSMKQKLAKGVFIFYSFFIHFLFIFYSFCVYFQLDAAWRKNNVMFS